MIAFTAFLRASSSLALKYFNSPHCYSNKYEEITLATAIPAGILELGLVILILIDLNV